MALLLSLVVAGLARAESPADRPPVITIGVVADNEPYSFFEGRTPTGFSIDVLREVARNANLTFDFANLTVRFANLTFRLANLTFGFD